MSVRIIFADSRGGIYTVSNVLHQAFVKFGIDCIMMNMNEKGNGIFIKIAKTFKEFNFISKNDVLILQHFDAIFLGVFLKFFGFKKIINVVHTDIVEYIKSSVIKKFILQCIFLFIRNDPVVFVSREAAEKAKYFFKLNNVTVIYNVFNVPINVDDYNNIRKKIVLGTVSRLYKSKNVDLAILVVNELNKRGFNVELNIFGDGDVNDTFLLKKLIEDLGGEKVFHMKGAIADKKIIFSSIDAIVSFSSIEGLPTVILESIGYKTPVFHTDCKSGPREIMSPSSVLSEKTDKYEKTNVGYLVKPVLNNKKYEKFLTEYEYEYVDILESFLIDLISSGFDMKYEFNDFEEDRKMEQWMKLIKDANHA